MKESSKRLDYHKYSWAAGEYIWAVTRSIGVVCLLAIFFYRSLLVVVPLSALGYLYFRRIGQRRQKEQITYLEEQFRECILSVAASLRAGYAVENAFVESIQDMKLLYGEESLICRELDLMRKGMIINITLEELLTDFALRSGSEEIEQFAEVFSIAKRSGGNLSAVIQNTAELIGRHIEAGRELRALLGGREMEQNIMKLMPFAILLYISISYQGYFDGLYHNLQGVLIMTGCLGVYLVAYWLGERILQGVVG